MKNGVSPAKSFRIKFVTAVVVFIFFVLIIVSFFGKKGLIEVYNAQKQKESLLEEIDRLEKIKLGLEREITELQTNPKSYEAKARDQLGLVYPDELLIIKADKTNSQDKTQTTKKK